MNNEDVFARGPDEREPGGPWQPLADHLEGVAQRAAQHASFFGAADWGRLAGLWHDLGKYQPAWQDYLCRGGPRVEHSGAGAAYAVEHLGGMGIPLAFVIAGHHAGLTNHTSSEDAAGRPLRERLESAKAALEAARPHVPEDILALSPPSHPLSHLPQPRNHAEAEDQRIRLAHWTRFLFSSLVDADFLDTEAFLDQRKAGLRPGATSQENLVSMLRQRLGAHLEQFASCKSASAVNQARAEILAACHAAAAHAPGFFSLTVPTGGGKTLSGMSFALRHAEQHGLRRVICVLPYTSIIEQNAKVYRDALGAEHVLEHHANLSYEKRRENLTETVSRRHELAQENWDAPVIVTTSVQFFESLHANRSSRCRKLHNIAKSVIILDEVQTLPPALLKAILVVLKELVGAYGCTVVLSTATPPALQARDALPEGITESTDIIADPAALARRLERVRYHWPEPEEEPIQLEVLAARLEEHERVLAIVDRRADAYELARLLSESTKQHVYHLSALMCPEHRSSVIKEIEAQLAAGKTCRVVSTQLIEAGVDLDFPVVYRALAGLDRIVQAGGRCNREGRLERGEVHVFLPPKPPPPGEMQRASEYTQVMLKDLGTIDTSDPEMFDRFFRGYYEQPHDRLRILTDSGEFNFATVAKNFKMIDDKGQVTVICPWGEGAEKITAFVNALEGGYLAKSHRRELQPFAVQVYTGQLKQLIKDGVVYEFAPEAAPDTWCLSPGHMKRYDDQYGLILASDAMADPGELVLMD